MRLCQKFFAGIVVAIATLVVLDCPALAAPIELSFNDCITLAMKNNQVIRRNRR